jgi:D-threonate/D-erythronate kinase
MFALQVFCIADDLTGALEIGSKFVAEGLESRVSTRQLPTYELSGGVQAHVLDAETRHLDPAEAFQKVSEISSAALRLARIVYKKTDSTLRGNVGSELRGMLASLPGTPVVYVPAYPEMGRTIRDGRLFVDAVPLEDTSFAADPLNPSRESRIDALLAPDVAVRRAASPEDIAAAAGGAVYVVDAETDDDIRRAAEVFSAGGLRFAAGPAAFAAHIARRIGRGAPRAVSLPSGVRTCLVVNGSLHGRSALQVDAALREWLPACAPEDVARGLVTSPWVFLDTGILLSSGLQRAHAVGEIVRRVLRGVEIDAMIVFGGDTAFGILRALAEPVLHPLGDVIPGVPVSAIGGTDLRQAVPGRTKPLYLVSKAGGFGAVDVLGSIRDCLSRA